MLMKIIISMLPFKISYFSIIAVAAGTKKNAIFPNRKSPVSLIASSFKNFKKRSRKSIIMLMTLPGNANGNTADTASPARHTAEIIVSCLIIFIPITPYLPFSSLYNKSYSTTGKNKCQRRQNHGCLTEHDNKKFFKIRRPLCIKRTLESKRNFMRSVRFFAADIKTYNFML